jgi:hypothetical protein
MDRSHTAQTIRFPAAAELLIDSMDRYKAGFPQYGDENTTSSNWRTNLPNYVMNGYFTRLAITQIQFFWNLPTIIPGYNETIVVVADVGGAEATEVIAITPGFYTPNTLAAEIEDQLQAAFPAEGFTCVFANGAFKIQATNAFLVVDAGSLDPTVYTSDEIREVVHTLQTLGFENATSDPAKAATTFIGGIPTMLPTRYIDILSSYITKFQEVKDSSTSQAIIYNCIIARVYPVPPNSRIDIAPDGGPSENPFIITIDYNTPKNIMWSPQEALANFDIQLRDEFGDLIPWSAQYGCEYQLTMQVSES